METGPSLAGKLLHLFFNHFALFGFNDVPLIHVEHILFAKFRDLLLFPILDLLGFVRIAEALVPQSHFSNDPPLRLSVHIFIDEILRRFLDSVVLIEHLCIVNEYNCLP